MCCKTRTNTCDLLFISTRHRPLPTLAVLLPLFRQTSPNWGCLFLEQSPLKTPPHVDFADLGNLEWNELTELVRLYVKENAELRKKNNEFFSAREQLQRDHELVCRENERLSKKLEELKEWVVQSSWKTLFAYARSLLGPNQISKQQTTSVFCGFTQKLFPLCTFASPNPTPRAKHAGCLGNNSHHFRVSGDFSRSTRRLWTTSRKPRTTQIAQAEIIEFNFKPASKYINSSLPGALLVAALPNNDQAIQVAGGQKRLVAVEADAQHRAGMALKSVEHRFAAGWFYIHKIHASILAAGDWKHW